MDLSYQTIANQLASAVLADSRRRAAQDNSLLRIAKPQQLGHLGLSEEMVRDYSILRPVKKLFNKGMGFDGPEAEYSRELEKFYGPTYSPTSFYVPTDITHTRALSSTPGAKGGYTIGSTIQGFFGPLFNSLVCFQLVAVRIQDQSTTAVFVKETTGPTVTWQGPENTSVSSGDPGFTQLAAKPHTVIAIHELTEQLLAQASPVTEAGVIRGLRAGLIVGGDQVMLSGAGAAQPLGIANTPNVNTVVGASLDRAKLIDMQTQAHNSNAVANPLTQGYVASPAVAALAAGRQEYTGSSTTLWQGSLAQGKIVGCPAMASKSLGASTLLFGDFSQLMMV